MTTVEQRDIDLAVEDLIREYGDGAYSRAALLAVQAVHDKHLWASKLWVQVAIVLMQRGFK